MSLSNLLRVNCSTYENPMMDAVVDQMEYDLDEIKNDDSEIEVEGLGLVDVNNIECDDGLDFEGFKKDLGKSIQDYLEDIYDMKGIFAKYGLEYTGISFYTPKAYNYESDSIDIHLKTIQESYDLEAMELRELIEKYIEEVRVEDCDGYMSFEPTDFNDVGIDDYCTLWAILEKEGIRDMMKGDLQNYFDEFENDILWNNCSPYYQIRVDGKIDWDTKYKLDYDNKILLLIK